MSLQVAGKTALFHLPKIFTHAEAVRQLLETSRIQSQPENLRAISKEIFDRFNENLRLYSNILRKTHKELKKCKDYKLEHHERKCLSQYSKKIFELVKIKKIFKEALETGVCSSLTPPSPIKTTLPTPTLPTPAEQLSDDLSEWSDLAQENDLAKETDSNEPEDWITISQQSLNDSSE